MKQLQARPAQHGRVAGLVYLSEESAHKPLLVLFNQWRSGAASILSRYIAELTLQKGKYGAVLFIDRIASGGVSDNQLSAGERQAMKRLGESQFAYVYADAIVEIIQTHKLPSDMCIGGSSAGAPAALAAASGLFAKGAKVKRVILVEPSGLITHGLKGRGSMPHAVVKHLIAYRHRLKRGWWTPMDKEQYFAKGTMFEHRARYWAKDHVFHVLKEALATPGYPPLSLVLSKTSHVHTVAIRQELHRLVRPPHRVLEVIGSHDHICQPPSLSTFYSDEAVY